MCDLNVGKGTELVISLESGRNIKVRYNEIHTMDCSPIPLAAYIPKNRPSSRFIEFLQ